LDPNPSSQSFHFSLLSSRYFCIKNDNLARKLSSMYKLLKIISCYLLLLLVCLFHLLQQPKCNLRSTMPLTRCHTLLQPSATPHVSRSYLHVKRINCTHAHKQSIHLSYTQSLIIPLYTIPSLPPAHLRQAAKLVLMVQNISSHVLV
jgi:hypothetical protein